MFGDIGRRHWLRNSHIPIRYAQQMAGHVSSKYIWRYVQPSANEIEEAIEDLFD